MIDLHSHILFETDDGSNNIEESVKMAKEAYTAGFTTICCTPHYLEPQYKKTKKENEETLNKLKEALAKENIPIELLLGNEIFIVQNMEKLIEEGKASQLGASEYILIELPMFQKLNNAIDILRDLPYSKIILAHPERYKYVQKDISYLDEFIEMGVLLQCNYESILGKYGIKAQKTMKKLLKQGKVDLLSTDTHKKESTYTKMPEIEKKLKKVVKKDYFEDLTVNIPKEILKNI
jgi:protein-tyrosine phosphatase